MINEIQVAQQKRKLMVRNTKRESKQMNLQYIIYTDIMDLCQRILQKILLNHQIKILVTVCNTV